MGTLGIVRKLLRAGSFSFGEPERGARNATWKDAAEGQAIPGGARGSF